MNKLDYIQDAHVLGFVKWAANVLPAIEVHLNISRAGTGRALKHRGPGVHAELAGLQQVVLHYHWRASWLRGHDIHFSDNWFTTRESLRSLGDWLREEVDHGTAEGALGAAMEIIRWGGDRNPRVGAARFLGGLPELRAYLAMARDLLSLDNANTLHLGGIVSMNAMLSKVHALLANDGLPIYDSRVSGAIGALVEIYRRTLEEPWDEIPPALRFKATDRGANRRVGALGPDSVDPGVFNRQQPDVCSLEWTAAKIRLGWLIESILLRGEGNGHPLIDAAVAGDESMPAKMRAFEAGLFMIGFRVDCIQWRHLVPAHNR